MPKHHVAEQSVLSQTVMVQTKRTDFRAEMHRKFALAYMHVFLAVEKQECDSLEV
jgi:Fe-S cluster biosynthesis and repair protein YggX